MSPLAPSRWFNDFVGVHLQTLGRMALRGAMMGAAMTPIWVFSLGWLARRLEALAWLVTRSGPYLGGAQVKTIWLVVYDVPYAIVIGASGGALGGLLIGLTRSGKSTSSLIGATLGALVTPLAIVVPFIALYFQPLAPGRYHPFPLGTSLWAFLTSQLDLLELGLCIVVAGLEGALVGRLLWQWRDAEHRSSDPAKWADDPQHDWMPQLRPGVTFRLALRGAILAAALASIASVVLVFLVSLPSLSLGGNAVTDDLAGLGLWILMVCPSIAPYAAFVAAPFGVVGGVFVARTRLSARQCKAMGALVGAVVPLVLMVIATMANYDPSPINPDRTFGDAVAFVFNSHTARLILAVSTVLAGFVGWFLTRHLWSKREEARPG